MRLTWRLARSAILATAVLAVLLAAPKVSTSTALAIWMVLVAALVLVSLIRHSRDHAGPEPASRFEQALRKQKPPAAQAVELLRMDRELALGSADADHAHRRLLPLLRATAAARIAARHGFQLERRPEAARALLGDDVWELLRPDRPPAADRHGPGVPQRQIAAVIEKVESL
jgi:hypothetical protein